MPDPVLVVVGYEVKMVSEQHPDGKVVSRLYHAKEAAEDFAALARKYAKTSATFFVTERIGNA